MTAEELDKRYEDNEEEAFADVVAMLLILNKAAVINEEFESGKPIAEHDYSRRLTEEEIYNCTEGELAELIAEMRKTKADDETVTVEVAENKKKEVQELN